LNSHDADNAAGHEHPACLADRVVRSLDEYLAIRAAKIESSAAAPRRSVV
jgi:hypothetical protein